MSNLGRPDAESPYTDAFYVNQSKGAYQSAHCVLSQVLAVVPVRSAVDIGCGVGTWTSTLLEYGVTDVLGIDGDHVNRELLRISPDCFQAWDLSKPLTIDRRFDLALCMEVAEHLPPARAESLIDDLVKLAPDVLFSAAVPGQGGVNHINERYLSYWASLFTARDYVLLDIIRPALWNDERCDWWYRQNTVLFVHKDNPLSRLRVTSGIDYIHPRLYENMLEEREVSNRPTIGFLLRSFPGSLFRSLRTRWMRLRR